MTNHHNSASSHAEQHQGFPWQYVIGFVLSLILTFVPLMLVVNHVIQPGPLVWAIMICAVLQIFVQLFLFMHFTESDGGHPAYHTITLAIGFFFTFLFIACSVWIMTFNSQVS